MHMRNKYRNPRHEQDRGKCHTTKTDQLATCFEKACDKHHRKVRISWYTSFKRVLSIHCLAALDRGQSVEELIDCLDRQAVQSMRKSMDAILEDKLDGLFFYAKLTSRRRGNIPFAWAGTETSNSGAEAVKSDPRCSFYEGGCRCWRWKHGVS